MATLAQYVPIKVVASWVTPSPFGVVDIRDGAIDGGEFLGIVSDVPIWARETDGHGSATRVKNENRGGRLTINLSASSPTNTILSSLVALDLVSEGIVGPIVVKDLNGDTIVEADGCFLIDVPDLSFGSDRGSRAWVWECAAIRKFAGGHDAVGVV